VRICIKSHSQVVKEKKETLGEFLNKGKQIFLGKMMMDMKKEETLRLTEFIINEEETLNEHEAVIIRKLAHFYVFLGF